MHMYLNKHIYIHIWKHPAIHLPYPEELQISHVITLPRSRIPTWMDAHPEDRFLIAQHFPGKCNPRLKPPRRNISKHDLRDRRQGRGEMMAIWLYTYIYICIYIYIFKCVYKYVWLYDIQKRYIYIYIHMYMTNTNFLDTSQRSMSLICETCVPLCGYIEVAQDASKGGQIITT